MAYDLLAKLKLKDEFSSKMRKAVKEAEAMNKAVNRMNKSMSSSASVSSRFGNNASKAFSAIKKGASSAASSVSSLQGQFVGLAAAIGGAYAAKKLWDSTVVSAAHNELSQIQIGAMFQDPKKAKAYMENLRRMAVDSPLLNSNEMFANSKSFIGQTQDLKTLEHAWKVVEKLKSWSPEQSIESVVFSMRELASGDAMSMVERMELPRGILNDIKKLKFKDQLVALDKLLAKLRITDKYIEDIGAAALSQWNQIKEKMDVALTDIGMGALKELKPVLVSINDALDGQGFKNFKNSLSKGVAMGFRDILNGARSAWGYIEKTYINNPKFQMLDIQGKISFVFDDLYRLFKEWLANGGQAKIDAIGKDLMTGFARVIENNAKTLISVGFTVGTALGQGILSGFAATLSQSPWAAAIMGGLAGAGIGSVVPGVGTAIGAVAGVGAGLATHYTNKAVNHVAEKNTSMKYNSGYRPSFSAKPVSSTNNNSYNINLNYKGTGNTTKDADALLGHMAKRINEARGLGAGGR